MNKRALIVLIGVLAVCHGKGLAQDAAYADSSKVTTSIFTIDAGMGSLRDTYISPITYDGYHQRIAYANTHCNSLSRWTRTLEGGIDYELTHNPAGNHTMHALIADFKWANMRLLKWRPWRQCAFKVGPMAQFRGGVLYNTNNSNNVVSARVHMAVGVNAMAAYHTLLSHKKLSITYEMTLPVMGAFFSPEYDEPYYEIYVGNHKNLAHFGWWGNRFDITNYLFADYQIGSHTVMRIGYRNRVECSRVCHITTRSISHAFVIGFGCNLSSSNR